MLNETFSVIFKHRVIVCFYLACDCNPNGSNGTTCSNEGQCLCQDRIEGKQCNRCKDGFYGFPNCKTCQCDEDGSLNNICNKSDGICRSCIPRVKGTFCEECQVNHCDFPTCKACKCNPKGSKNEACNVLSCDCDCKQHVIGQKCDRCQWQFYGFPDCQGKQHLTL